jgi:hypothetical protein
LSLQIMALVDRLHCRAHRLLPLVVLARAHRRAGTGASGLSRLAAMAGRVDTLDDLVDGPAVEAAARFGYTPASLASAVPSQPIRPPSPGAAGAAQIAVSAQAGPDQQSWIRSGRLAGHPGSPGVIALPRRHLRRRPAPGHPPDHGQRLLAHLGCDPRLAGRPPQIRRHLHAEARVLGRAGNNDVPSMRLPGGAEPQRWPIDAAETA